MKCPNCDSENNEGAKFCKKCGTPLNNKVMNHESVINSINDKSASGNNTTKYIIVALVIVAVVLAGAFVFLYSSGSGHDNGQQAADNNQDDVSADDGDDSDSDKSDDDSAKSTTASSSKTSSSSSMKIQGGTFETGGGLSDKTYASIYVGPEHSGESVTIQIKYSRDGSALNNGNMVPKTVDSSGYINVKSADAYKYFPDYAEINLFDSSGNLLDTQSVSLSPESGTQSF